jgi:hypothetical protein
MTSTAATEISKLYRPMDRNEVTLLVQGIISKKYPSRHSNFERIEVFTAVKIQVTVF